MDKRINLEVGLPIKIKGQYRLSIIKPDGTEVFPNGTELKDNLVLDQGLHRVFSLSGYNVQARVGTSAIVASYTDTTLYSPVAYHTEYSLGSGECGTTGDVNTGTVTHKRTYLFRNLAASGPIRLREFSVGTGTTETSTASRWNDDVTLSETDEVLKMVHIVTAQFPTYVTPQTVTGTATSEEGTFNFAGQLKLASNVITMMYGRVNATTGSSERPGFAYLSVGRITGQVSPTVYQPYRIYRTALTFPAQGSIYQSGTYTNGDVTLSPHPTYPTILTDAKANYIWDVTSPPGTTNVYGFIIHPTTNSAAGISSGNQLIFILDNVQTKLEGHKVGFSIYANSSRL